MKNLLLLLAFCFFLFTAKSQDVTGVWRGTMVQDTPARTINFEMAIKELNGKLYGYCYRLFIVNDSLIYNTVRIEAKISNNTLVVEDEKSVSKNYEDNTSKIRVVYFFKLDGLKTNSNQLAGEWTTNRYKRYMAVTGTVNVEREPDFRTTQIIKRLEEKKLADDMVFEVKQTAPVIASGGNTATPADTPQISIVKVNTETKPVNNKPGSTTTEPPKETKIITPVTKPAIPEIKPEPAVVKQQPTVTPPQNKPKQEPPVVKNQSPAVPLPQKPKPEQPIVKQTPVVKTESKPQLQQPTPDNVRQSAASVNMAGNDKTNAAAVQKPAVSAVPPPPIKNDVINTRAAEVLQTVDIAEDSVILSLYDNGEIDGDTVSVFLNNEQIISKAGLKATAYKKTIMVPKGQSAQLTLFAENLGSIPPNTGLLVIYTGEQRYQIHFASTMSKNAVIVLRRQ